MLQLNEMTPGPLSPTAEATARIIAGGPAYLADIAWRLAPYFARSESRPPNHAPAHAGRHAGAVWRCLAAARRGTGRWAPQAPAGRGAPSGRAFLPADDAPVYEAGAA